MKSRSSLGLVLTLYLGAPAFAQVTVATHHYNNARTGLNLNETVLTTSNVNAGQFGKVATFPVDGQVYAQPLYIPNVTITGKGTFNVLYVATMNNSVYAFNADAATATVLWSRNYNNAGAGVAPVPYTDVQFPQVTDINSPVGIGILSSPVIDPANFTLYFVVRTKENGAYFQRLHAIDIRSGAELAASPVVIAASVKRTSGATVTFDPMRQNQRVPLALANGMVYIAWASHNDIGPFNGWIMAYKTAQQASGALTQAYVTDDTLDGADGGIWQGGSAPAIDASGNLYFTVGNGDWNGSTNFGQSVIKVSPALKIVDYFTPDNWQVESNNDADLGCGGLVLIPGTNLLLNGSKQGILYLTNTSNMGHLVSGNTQIPQVFAAATGHIHGGPAYYNSPTLGPLLYIWSENDYLKAFHFNGTGLNTSPISESAFPDSPGMPGGFITVSANNSVSGTGVVWVNVPFNGDANQQTVSGVLRAFDADNLGNELWDSHINSFRDDFGNFAKDVPPVVANGKVYMATFSNSIAVYGLLSGSGSTTIQINAGGTAVGSYAADTDTGGFTASTTNSIDLSGVPNPAPLQVYQGYRYGPSTYTIPGLTAGNRYTVRLHFAESYWSSTGQRRFNVAINGTSVLSNFDIIATAGASNKALVESFSATANAQGAIVVSFTNGSADNALIAAIDVTNVPIQPVYQVRAAGAAVGSFAASPTSGGYTYANSNAINTSGVSNPAPQAVYQSERFGPSTFTVSGLTAGKQYTVRLHFAEIYWTNRGQRIFDVAINGSTVLSDFDILSALTTPNTAIVEQFTASANSSGQIVINFINGAADNAKISGIEVQ